MSFQLSAPNGKFTITVETEDRRDVFIRRGYTLTGQSEPKPARVVTRKVAKP